jgi:hypothetical protein
VIINIIQLVMNVIAKPFLSRLAFVNSYKCYVVEFLIHKTSHWDLKGKENLIGSRYKNYKLKHIIHLFFKYTQVPYDKAPPSGTKPSLQLSSPSSRIGFAHTVCHCVWSSVYHLFCFFILNRILVSSDDQENCWHTTQ